MDYKRKLLMGKLNLNVRLISVQFPSMLRFFCAQKSMKEQLSPTYNIIAFRKLISNTPATAVGKTDWLFLPERRFWLIVDRWKRVYSHFSVRSLFSVCVHVFAESIPTARLDPMSACLRNESFYCVSVGFSEVSVSSAAVPSTALEALFCLRLRHLQKTTN